MRNFIAYFTQFYTNETLLNFEGKKPTPTFQPFPFSLSFNCCSVSLFTFTLAQPRKKEEKNPKNDAKNCADFFSQLIN